MQQDALRDFLSLYQATREDLTSQILAGGGSAADRLKVQNALFRSDGQSTMPLVLFGDGSKNSYANVRSVLTNLGIKNATSGAHQNHFHIYLKPPSLQAIVKPGGQNLLTGFESNDTIHSTNGDQTMMLDVNLPIPDEVLNPPALIAKAKVKFRDSGGVKASDEKGFKKVITSCTDVPGYASLDPIVDVLAYLGQKQDPETGVWSPEFKDEDLKFSVLQHPRHGTVGHGLLDGDSRTYGYIIRERKPDGTGAYQGPDRVVYLVEVKGQKFKVVINLLLGYSSDGPGGEVCVHHRFSLNNGTQVQSVSYASGLGSLLTHATQSLTAFQNLAGTAVGNTTGSGLYAQITLDDNAAGHGWYVDATPLDNTDDFLPTADAHIWQAKPGSSAEGKMDMLSVLLHEYGHALGLEHTGDQHGFMAETLQPGQRKLPTAQELEHMAQLVTTGTTNNTGDTSGGTGTVPNTITLKEAATAQTTLSQAFILGANYKLNSFTFNERLVSQNRMALSSFTLQRPLPLVDAGKAPS